MVMGSPGIEADVVVVGAGPGGYVAAMRAADLGREVVLVEERAEMGGVCLLEGCIPSKTLIHTVEVAHLAKEAKKMGLVVSGMKFDLETMRGWTRSVIGDLSKGISGLLKKRGVEVVRGRARFEGPHALKVTGGEIGRISFKHCILATGSRATMPWSPALDLWTAREALTLPEVPEKLAVIGGGYIGLELGFVYAALGSKVTVVEMMPSLLTGCDPDLAAVVERSAKKQFDGIMLEAKVEAIEKAGPLGYQLTVTHKGETKTHDFSRVFVAVGRRPNTEELGLENTRIELDTRGYIPVDAQCRTSEPSIFAIGDITPGFGLAHRASHMGKIAAEVVAGHDAAFDNMTVPAVVFTDPEVSWTGLTETEAKAQGRAVTVGKFPLGALGRAKGMGKVDGFAKVLSDPESGLVLGAGFVGPHASDLVAEATLAIEMGATLYDLAHTIHPHPTLSELTMEAAEVAAGTVVHIYAPKGGAKHG